jgi:ABC-type branched-subunit amino acid transport system ATPase component
MADLLLDSLEIQGFRAFKHLTIERLGRVNLVVGKNGVGKTALLEAVHVYANGGSPIEIGKFLKAKDEGSLQMVFGGRDNPDSVSQGSAGIIRYLFNGRPNLSKLFRHVNSGEVLADLKIGPLDSPDRQLVIGVEKRGSSACMRIQLKSYYIDECYSINNEHMFTVVEVMNSKFVSSGGIDKDFQVGRWWDDIALTDKESEVLEVLRLVAPEVQDVNLKMSEFYRIPFVKIDLPEPIPLHSMGEGMYRLFGIALALVNAENGVLLIDEVETGLHYSVQPEMWKLIFETAQRLNVQVFATTHSLDCLRAFEHAASQYGEEESMLISLRRHQEDPERIVAVLADKEELDTIVHSHIEVR